MSAAEDRRESPSAAWEWTAANVVTVARIALVPVVALLAAQERWWWAFAVFLVAALTDMVDGWIARRVSDGVSSWGKLFDPLADKILVLGCLAVLASQRGIGWWVVGLVAAREVSVTRLRQVLLARGTVMPASMVGKVKTVVQLTMVGIWFAPVTGDGLRSVSLWAMVAVTAYSAVSYGIAGARLLRES